MKFNKVVFSTIIVFILSSCSLKYTTPGSDVKISSLADEDVAKILSNKPAAEFPVNIAVARIQAPNYSNNSYNRRESTPDGRFSMILTREPDEEKVISELSKLKGIKQISPFNRLLLPYNYQTIKDLRLAAAKMKAQMLLVYTFDTEFSIDAKNYGPQNVFALGYLKNKEVKVRTTSSVALFDVQTEYLFGLAEATAEKEKKSNIWKENQEVDQLRMDAEKESFSKLAKEIEKMWNDVYLEYNKNK
ncbi:hypothetical protein [Chryseobacterium koreense]|uniref:Lipoprotein n=1 Tax=Chryseobacterium koreense CCUG 49689 TaxID=1304281 RepID=A0A0J7LTS7_9FLAO|nr:hypothetical protein [Chryseobacterium koreense]KMQ72340.1 hypothetical protein ACM44_02550 [Chryseobacterium koreense CCUG 49689]MBB5333964.1 hypothetical protein [Chryseobacterium koreense]